VPIDGISRLEDALVQAFTRSAEKVILVDPKMCYCSKLSREEG